MAEAQAQNKLGELFVDLGVGGLGKTLKALNSVSASFLLTKNAATQTLKPIVNMSKEGGQLVTALGKINAVTGLSVEKLQSIRNWSKLNNISFESLVGSIENVQQSLMDIKLGKGINKGFQLLGIEAWQLDPKDPLKALDLIQKKLKQVNEVTGATALRELGMSQDLLYTFKQAKQPLSKAIEDEGALYNLSEEQTKLLERQQSRWNEINTASEKIKLNIASWKFSEELLEAVADMLTIISNKGFLEGSKELFKKNLTVENTHENRDKWEFIKRNPYRFLPKWLKSTEFMIEQEQKRIEWYDKKYGYKRRGGIYIGDEEISGLDYKAAEHTPKAQFEQYMGAKQINAAPETPPPLPNVAPSSYTTTNSNKSINYNPVYNMQFEVIGDGSAEQAQKIMETVNNQVTQNDLTFSQLVYPNDK